MRAVLRRFRTGDRQQHAQEPQRRPRARRRAHPPRLFLNEVKDPYYDSDSYTCLEDHGVGRAVRSTLWLITSRCGVWVLFMCKKAVEKLDCTCAAHSGRALDCCGATPGTRSQAMRCRCSRFAQR